MGLPQVYQIDNPCVSALKYCIMKKILTLAVSLVCLFSFSCPAHGFWIWTPKDKKLINPKTVAKDTPKEQFDWAMRFFNQSDFKAASDEFIRLTAQYPDSDLAPEAEYYAGRSFEELGKYYFAFQHYQKTIDNYPFTKRLDEIAGRQYNIANIFQNKDVPKLMDIELSVALDKAAEIYKKVVDNSPFCEYADKSLFNMAECYRRQKVYDKAIEAYEKIVNDYPESTLAAEARYQAAYTKYESSLSPEYDQESTEQAMKEFKEMSGASGTGAEAQFAKEAGKVFDELKNKKAESDLKVAEFYEKLGKYESALMYYEDIKAKFPDTDAAKYSGKKIETLGKKVKK